MRCIVEEYFKMGWTLTGPVLDSVEECHSEESLKCPWNDAKKALNLDIRTLSFRLRNISQGQRVVDSILDAGP